MSATPYTSHQITVLTGLQAVRRRPAMYIGSTGPAGLLQLVAELVQNSVDEAMAGACAHIAVRLLPGGAVEVEDDGRGVPIDPHPLSGITGAELVFTTLHAGGKFGSSAGAAGAYGIAGGLHGVGAACVNALSSALELEVRRDGQRLTLRFAAGEPLGPPEIGVHPGQTTGTRVRYTPDPEIFGAAALDLGLLRRRLLEQAFLHPGLTVTLTDARGPRPVDEHLRFDTGVEGFVAHLNADRGPLHPRPAVLRGEVDGHAVECALQWTSGYAEECLSYVNAIFTANGGAHVDGLRAGLAAALGAAARKAGLLGDDGDELPAGYDLREGLTAVLSLRMAAPEYEGQTKTTLTSEGAAAAVAAVVGPALEAWLGAHPDAARAIVGKAIEASRARQAARRASERARYQSVDALISREVYRQQFGIRSANWHQSAAWITDEGILGAQAALWDGPDDARVLDVCCGSGVVGAAFRGKVGHITGLDLTPQMLELAATRLDAVQRGDVYDLPFPAASFDLVTNREVLHLLPRPELPLAQIFRVLRPGGTFIVGQMVPYGPEDAPWFFRVVKKKQPLFFNNLMPEDMRRLLQGAGFIDLVEEEVFCWEDIDRWIDTWETPPLQRHEIRDLYLRAPAAVRRVHPFELRADGRIHDRWRWVLFRARKPA